MTRIIMLEQKRIRVLQADGKLMAHFLDDRGRPQPVLGRADRDVVARLLCFENKVSGRLHHDLVEVTFPQPEGKVVSVTYNPGFAYMGYVPFIRTADDPGGTLKKVAWFCRGEARENLRAAAADLRKDVHDMRKKGCGPLHILAVSFWITTTTIVPIVWDGCVRFSKKLPMLGTVVRAVAAFLRKIDPPRLG